MTRALLAMLGLLVAMPAMADDFTICRLGELWINGKCAPIEMFINSESAPGWTPERICITSIPTATMSYGWQGVFNAD